MLAHLGAMLARLRAMLAHLGAMLAHLGAMLAQLGAMLGHLGAMLAHLGGYVGPSWGYVGPTWTLFGPYVGLCWLILRHLEAQDRKNGKRKKHCKTRGYAWSAVGGGKPLSPSEKEMPYGKATASRGTAGPLAGFTVGVSTSASPLPFPLRSSNKILRGKAWHQVSLKTRDEMQKPAPMFLGFWPHRQLGLLQNKFTWKTFLRTTRSKTKQWWVAIGIAQSNTLFTALRVRIGSRALEARRRHCGENTILALQTRRFSTLLNAPRCGENTILVLQARRFSTLLNAPRCGVASIVANQLTF